MTWERYLRASSSLPGLEQAEKRRCTSLEDDLRTQWELAAKKNDECQSLREKMAGIERRMGEQSRVFEEKTKWFGPHVDKLETSVHSTKRAYSTLETDVQLLSIMYKESLRDLEQAQRRTRDVEAERDLMASKLRELLKKLQLSKSEERRKDAIARKTLIARRTALEATALAREEKTSIAGMEKDARRFISELQERLKLVEERCKDYAAQKSKLEERLSDVGSESEEKKNIIEKLTKEKIQMSKLHSSQMKELVMRPAKEEVDSKLAELRGQLEEANMTNEALKEALASSQLGK
jgi:chromosome segregation ATPase